MIEREVVGTGITRQRASNQTHFGPSQGNRAFIASWGWNKRSGKEAKEAELRAQMLLSYYRHHSYLLLSAGWFSWEHGCQPLQAACSQFHSQRSWKGRDWKILFLESDSRILALPFIWANYIIFWVSDSFSEQWDNHRICAAFSCSVVSDSLRSIPMDCSPPGPSVHGVLQARILEWVAMPFFRGSSQPRDKNPGLLHCRQILYHLSLPGKAQSVNLLHKN